MNKNKFISEPTEAACKVVEVFGRDILTDPRRFCSAFSDFAPKLNKEKTAFFVALSENAGEIYISSFSDAEQNIISPEDINKRAFTVVSEFLNNQKAEMVVSALSSAMGWGGFSAGKVIPQAVPDTPDFSDDLFKNAENGNINAQFNLGERFYFGNGVKQSYIQAVHWFLKAAQAGNSSAQKKLGDCYHAGQGIPKDYSLAVKWYAKAAEQGDYEAQKALILCYRTGGFNLVKDPVAALHLAKKYGIKSTDESLRSDMLIQSAETGSIHAQLKLADNYYRGQGFPVDKTAAFYWYEKAALQNNAEAQFRLAQCCANGEGTEKSDADAFYWYEKSAENGYIDALNNLAGCYYYGKGVSAIPRKAAELYRKAAEAGNAYAQYNYGECCYNGIGILRNLNQAVNWYKKAAAQNNSDAQYSLGWCLYNGEGVPQDYNAAKRYFELSAQQRNPHAQLMLAYCCLNGQGTERNYAKAAEWFGKAAAKGITEAAEMLVKCLATGGFYLPQDVEKARKIADRYGVELSAL